MKLIEWVSKDVIYCMKPMKARLFILEIWLNAPFLGLIKFDLESTTYQMLSFNESNGLCYIILEQFYNDFTDFWLYLLWCSDAVPVPSMKP